MTLSNRTIISIISIVTLVRIVLMIWIPIKNDEAYYLLWAQNLGAGYYDHPPLIGWLLWAMTPISSSIVWYRMVALVAGLVATWGVYHLARSRYSEQGARLAAVMFALSPSSLWLLFISNDAPLLILLVLSVVAFDKADREKNYLLSWTSGLLLGLAFLAKYLAVIVGIGYLVYALLDKRKERLRHVVLVLAGVFPFVVQHIHYNYYNCWNTINFHLHVRNADNSFNIGNVAGYLFELILVLTPWGLWYLYRLRKQLPAVKDSLLLAIVATSVVLIGIVSFKSIVGLHFLLVFSPFAFVYIGVITNARYRFRALALSGLYALLLAGILFGLLLYPLERMKGWVHHSNFVVGLAPRDLCVPLEKYKSMPMFTNYYAQAGILSYSCKIEMQVLFGGSNYGREMDQSLDVRALAGKQLAIMEPGVLNPDNYRRFFRKIRVDRFDVHGAPFSVVVGEHFDFERYREEFLSGIRDRYYSPPAWLPKAGRCPFNEKYFPLHKEDK